MNLRSLAFAALAACGMLAAYAFGARAGFEQGYIAGHYTNEVVSAGLFVAHHGADETGPNQLIPETLIDSALITALDHHEGYIDPPFYAPDDVYLELAPVLSRLSRYRKHNPSTNDHAEARAAILEAMAKYGDE